MNIFVLIFDNFIHAYNVLRSHCTLHFFYIPLLFLMTLFFQTSPFPYSFLLWVCPLVWCSSPRVSCIHDCSGSVTSRRKFFKEFLTAPALTVFPPCSPSIGGTDIDVPHRAEHSTVAYFQDFNHAYVSELTLTYSKRSFSESEWEQHWFIGININISKAVWLNVHLAKLQ